MADPATASTLDRLISSEEIRRLAHRYAVAVDALDLDTLVNLFVPDVDLGSRGRGRDALRAAYALLLGIYPYTVHNVGTHTFEFESPNSASGVVYCRAEMEMDNEWVVKMVMYCDRYQRRDGMWLFSAREVRAFYATDVLRRPIGLPQADPEAVTVGRGTAPQFWPTWRQFHDQEGEAVTARESAETLGLERS